MYDIIINNKFKYNSFHCNQNAVIQFVKNLTSSSSTLSTNQVNALGIFSGSSQITLSGDVTGTANASVISSIDGGSI